MIGGNLTTLENDKLENDKLENATLGNETLEVEKLENYTLENDKAEVEKKEYVITIDGKNKRREIRLSPFAFNAGIFLAMISVFIFIGTCSYSVYSALHSRQNTEIVRSVQRAGEMQQEQLLTISRKAVNLSETIQNLAQQEEELRIQAGLSKPAREDKIPPKTTEDEIPELEEIKPIEGLPKPEELPALEKLPETVEIPAPKSEWKSPADGGYNGATVQTPAPAVNTPPVVNTPPAPVVNPAPKSEWKSPADGGYNGTQIQTSANFNSSKMVAMSFSSIRKFWGQGGPLPELALRDVSEALKMIEERVAIRLESLDEFQSELKTRREQMANVLPVPANTVGTYGNIVINNGFANDLNLNLGQFGGSPSANPNVPAIWPTTGVVTSPYGLRWGGTDFHPGIDIANDMGTPIIATADGIVEYAGWNAGGYGNMVDINHGNGLMTRYGHASQVVVTTGQSVKRGQLIAYMGSTGFSTGPHCHYEVHVNGQRVNPISYL